MHKACHQHRHNPNTIFHEHPQQAYLFFKSNFKAKSKSHKPSNHDEYHDNDKWYPRKPLSCTRPLKKKPRQHQRKENEK